MKVRLVSEDEARRTVTYRLAIPAVRDAFAELARGNATVPSPIELRFPAGELHVKCAYIHGSRTFSIKVATGFYQNPAAGLAVGSGVVLVHNAMTGGLETIIFDNGYLTDLRTGAAGAVAADFLAADHINRVGVIGSGNQARVQLLALLEVRSPTEVVVYGRTDESAANYAQEMAKVTGLPIRVVATPREAVEGASLVITSTPSSTPIVRAEWLSRGVHLTAIGADMPYKQELDVEVLRRADKVVVDLLSQARASGELHHAIDAGTMHAGDVYAELGEIAAGRKEGRTSEAEITVADLTGLGVQDAALADLVASAASRGEIGRSVEI